jgi:hypothetical protein
MPIRCPEVTVTRTRGVWSLWSRSAESEESRPPETISRQTSPVRTMSRATRRTGGLGLQSIDRRFEIRPRFIDQRQRRVRDPVTDRIPSTCFPPSGIRAGLRQVPRPWMARVASAATTRAGARSPRMGTSWFMPAYAWREPQAGL